MMGHSLGSIRGVPCGVTDRTGVAESPGSVPGFTGKDEKEIGLLGLWLG